mmetsp:Transcript_7316/g.14528  ORF Transcript_7316/g.14528 Transcript_7316/m.14528 type:complete len:202 (+) Transcript_7316:1462-2067(+)
MWSKINVERRVSAKRTSVEMDFLVETILSFPIYCLDIISNLSLSICQILSISLKRIAMYMYCTSCTQHNILSCFIFLKHPFLPNNIFIPTYFIIHYIRASSCLPIPAIPEVEPYYQTSLHSLHRRKRKTLRSKPAGLPAISPSLLWPFLLRKERSSLRTTTLSVTENQRRRLGWSITPRSSQSLFLQPMSLLLAGQSKKRV